MERPHLVAAGATLLLLAAAAPLAQPSDTAPAFEVASIRVTQGGTRGGMGMLMSPIKLTPGSLTMRGVSFRVCVAWANGVKEFQVNGPDWIDQARYDIIAKTG